MCSVRELPAWATVTAAGTGGLMYWLAIYPVDQVKSAIMCDSLNPAERVYPNMGAAFSVRTFLGISPFHLSERCALLGTPPSNCQNTASVLLSAVHTCCLEDVRV